jgi:hypothetical protein
MRLLSLLQGGYLFKPLPLPVRLFRPLYPANLLKPQPPFLLVHLHNFAPAPM